VILYADDVSRQAAESGRDQSHDRDSLVSTDSTSDSVRTITRCSFSSGANNPSAAGNEITKVSVVVY